ncbi:hypothetical protein DSCO28_00580 [Desulfosarcina ovata subsp. sediminis]|uniref:Uncharacterized protein n=1 Tax=Desulfosarcina ovata subsp. sediminis TaxID=885957 RepID=A0A5K7ZC01_9BACT|nr:hypothetical protein [Desulfosarcina ovata]BBO79492.1 hypothetical protein DSCO28_00580 [Desulfosarcina ovata subsp. sediminis]
MRYFPFKTLILCVLLPPLVYVFSLQFIENTLQARYDRKLSATYTGDTRDLFDGSIRLQDAIRKNIDAFISNRKLVDWGVHVAITVKTNDGVYLYPDAYNDQRSEIGVVDSVAIARENFKILSEGLIKTIDVKIDHNTPIANAILLFCVLVALLVLFIFYQHGLKLATAEEQARKAALDDLEKDRQNGLDRLKQLETQRYRLSEKIETMRKTLDDERRKASATEDEMMDELLGLEEKIAEHQALKNEQLGEIEHLKVKLEQFEKEKDAQNRQSLKGIAAVKKRFGALYKNIDVHDRAVTGFMDLTEEMKIKVEEVVYQLNDDPKQVTIKRKVFGKKNRETVFEVIFAYKGRLYFRNISNHRVEVLVIGTKLTQNKDLAFLDKL